MCTSLIYKDSANRAYLGRTLELSVDLPYQIAWFPKKLALSSKVGEQPEMSWDTGRAFIAITMPSAVPRPDSAFEQNDLKVVEGINDAGLTFSVQSYSQASGQQDRLAKDQAALSAQDLGAWVLSHFSTVPDVKASLSDLPVVLEPTPILGGLEMPFHYSVHDRSGAGLVIEFHRGVRTVYDNPVGVMTNAPEFSWHLTNLHNYTFLTNVDHSKATFGSYEAVQPGAGISKAGVPGTDTSVDRFVRAAYYAQFAEKQTDPDKAVEMVAHIMNNFDRPRGIALDYPEQGSSHLQVKGQKGSDVETEFTTWTSLSDLDRGLFFVRGSGGMNYSRYDLTQLASITEFRHHSLVSTQATPHDATLAFANT